MDVKTFIKESLIQITKGIQEANKELKEQGAERRPFSLQPGASQEKSKGIDFDIAVIVKSEKEGKAGAKLDLAVVSVGGGGGISTAHESVSRIKFSVYVEYWVG